MDDLMLQKGFSSTDDKYVQIFKKRPIILKNNSTSDYNKLVSSNLNKNDIIAFEKPVISTTKKLNQIIQNLESKKKGIRKKFLIDKNKQININNYHFKIKELLKKKNIVEKRQIFNKVERLDGIKESFKRLIRFKRKYAIDENIVKVKIREHNRTPPICNYNPNFDYITKHVPIPDLKGHQNINLIKLKKEEENKKQMEEKNDSYDNEEETMEENDYININAKKLKKYPLDNILINSYQNKFSNNHRRNNRRRNYFSNIKSMDNKIKYMKNFENYGAPRYHSISIDLIPLKSVNTKKISVPIFNKMISRDKNNYLYNHLFLADYEPNYNSIDSDANKYKYIDVELKNKKNKLRKIMTSSNPPGEYLLLPILNK